MRPDPQSVFERLGWRPKDHWKCQRRCVGCCDSDAEDAGYAGNVDYGWDVGRLPMGSALENAPLQMQASVELETLAYLQEGLFVQAALGDLGLRMILWVPPQSIANAS